MNNQPPLNPDALDRVRDAVAEALGDAYHCTRDWSAWSYGTMSQDDFSLAWEDSDFVDEMARAVLAAALPEVTSVESIPAKINLISWEGQHELDADLAPDETLVVLTVKTDRSWSLGDKVELTIHRPEANDA